MRAVFDGRAPRSGVLSSGVLSCVESRPFVGVSGDEMFISGVRVARHSSCTPERLRS